MTHMFSVAFILCALSFAGNAPVLESMHGPKMSVQYFIYNAGLHGLVVQEKQEDGSFKEAQKIRMFLKKDEFLTNQYGFKCENKEKEFIYAIASKKRASRKKKFKPSRGWFVDGTSLSVVKAPEAISCKWQPEAETKYPFK